jgi:hypothetical protein
LSDRSPEEAVPYLDRFVREAPGERYAPDIAKAKALLASLESSRGSS